MHSDKILKKDKNLASLTQMHVSMGLNADLMSSIHAY